MLIGLTRPFTPLCYLYTLFTSGETSYIGLQGPCPGLSLPLSFFLEYWAYICKQIIPTGITRETEHTRQSGRDENITQELNTERGQR